jgi:hydrogenase nickel incorporation protein HypA/HybF
MHELPVTESILKIANDAAREAGAQRITVVHLLVGDLSGVVDDSIQFYFDILSKDTAAEGAVLRIQRVPGQATCLDCGSGWTVAPPLSPVCPGCGGPRVRVSGGRELRVESIEVDEQ